MGKWDSAEELADGISYVIEYIIFTLFIYEEAMQIINRLILQQIINGEATKLRLTIMIDFDFIMIYARGFFESYGILSVYGMNAYSAYFFSSMMTREWAELYLTGKRMEYSFSKTPLF